MKNVVPILCLCLFFLKVGAQGEISEEKKALVRNEHTYSIILNSNGWGLGYSYGKMKNIHRKSLYSIEWNSVKDPKEKKFIIDPNYRRFVFGKQNDFFSFNFGYGNLITLYDKKDKGGIEIRCFYNIGAVLGFLKPFYYEVEYKDSGGNLIIKEVRFEDLISSSYNLKGGASYFKGFDEFSVIPGAYAKFGGSFEFSKKDLVINALEGGVALNIYPQKVEIMANDLNKFYFLSIFISYRFGKISHPRAKKITEKEY